MGISSKEQEGNCLPLKAKKKLLKQIKMLIKKGIQRNKKGCKKNKQFDCFQCFIFQFYVTIYS